MIADKQNAVALYVRVSTQDQADAFSLDAQEFTLREDARRRGKWVYQVYRDAGASGFREDREAFNQLMQDAKQGCFQEVVVWTVSRVARKLSYLLSIIETLQQHGVALISVTENFQADTPAGKMVLSTMGAIAEMQRTSWLEASRLGMARRNREGYWSGGVPLGYTMHEAIASGRGGELVIVPGEADTVRRIFTLYDQGLGYKAIVNRLNAENLTTKTGSRFAVCAVKNILENALYAGTVTMGGVEAPGVHEAIIPDNLWQRVQERLVRHAKPTVKTINRTYLLSGLLRCPVCGSGMVPAHSKNRRQDGTFRITHYYQCGSYLNKGKAACRANSVRADQAEAKVLAWLQDILTSPFWARRVADTLRLRQQAALTPHRREREQMEGRITGIEKQQKELLDRYESGKLARDSFFEEAKRLKAQKEELATKISTAGTMQAQILWTLTDIKACFRQFGKVLDQATDSQKLQLLRSLLEAIQVNEMREVAKLVLKVPLPETGHDTTILLPLTQAQ